MLYTKQKEIEEVVLFSPALISGLSCQSLNIVTGFIDCGRIFTHLIALKDGSHGRDKIYMSGIRINIILGMTKGANLTLKKHQQIVDTIKRINKNKDMPSIACRYIYTGKEVHSKVYVWSKDTTPLVAFCGSANYTINAFQKRRECMTECSASDAKKYYDELLADSVDCLDEDVETKIHFSSVAPTTDEIDDDNFENLSYEDYDGVTPLDTLTVSLLKADGGVGYGSGINWGIRPNGTKRNRNQAYIPYNKNDKKEGFFPDRINPTDKNCPLFKVITKDIGAFYMRMAQSNNKGLHSAEDNSIIGKWIRDRIGVQSGTFVTVEDLQKYGTTSVTFRKYKNGVYLLDFEPQNK